MKKRWGYKPSYDPKIDLLSAIDAKQFPASERELIQHIGQILSGLMMYLIKFEAAIELSEFCDVAMYDDRKKAKGGPYQPTRMYTLWQSMAISTGALMVYHFYMAIEGIRRSITGAPVFSSKLDHTASGSKAKAAVPKS